MSRDQKNAKAKQYIRNLSLIAPLSEAIVKQGVSALNPAPGSSGLDIGCGIGRDTRLLANAVGSRGRVMGLDRFVEFFRVARQKVDRQRPNHPPEWIQGQIDQLPVKTNALDWIWCKDVFWPQTGIIDDPIDTLKSFRRVVRPGGKVALLFWTTQSLLAGYPKLEAKLNLLLADKLPYLKTIEPDHHFLRAIGWMKAAGWINPSAQPLSASFSGPLDTDRQKTLHCIYQMFYDETRLGLTADEYQLVQQLTDPQSTRFLPRRDDFFCSVNYTMFVGTKPSIFSSSTK